MTPFLQVRDLSKIYTQGSEPVPVLQSLALDIKPGEVISIIGQSGSGKSTLLSLLSGLDRPDQGSIMIDQRDIARMDEHELTQFRGRMMGIVFQGFHLLNHLTALENIALPLDVKGDDQAEAKALAAIKLVNLLERRDHLPHQLSGGEKQRVAIARAFVTNPPLLLADEPSGNLDAKTGAEVMNILFELVRDQGMAMVLVTHNAELASRCQRCFRLEGGKLLEVNTKETLS